MKKTYMRLCSMLLTIIMIINLLPLNILAAELNESLDTTDMNSGEIYTESPEIEEAYIVEEVIDGRTEYSKEYRLSNGLHMAAMFAEPIHFESNGEWKEIDNTLKLSNGKYVNAAGIWEVSFPQQLTSNVPVSITKDGYTLSFYMTGEVRANTGNLEVASMDLDTDNYSIQSAQSVSAQIHQVDLAEVKATSQYPETVSEKTQSRLEYDNVFSHTDIRYDLQSNRVKESIIIESYDSSLQGYKYTLNVGALTPILADSGEIYLYDESKENVVMVMPAPFLVDNAGERSTDVNVALTGSGSTYTLMYTLPHAWLSSNERQWPVILDPVVEADTNINNIRDASVYEKGTAYDYTYEVLEIGHNENHGIMRAFLKYDELPELTSADVIVYATINIYSGYEYTSQRVIEAHKVLDTWKSETITWANQPDYNRTVEDYVYVSSQKYYTWEITDIVREWYEGENTGVMFKARDSVENTTSTDSYRTQFYSSDYSTYVCPQLFICFRNNNGLESYWDYTASSAGRAGTGYINNYTGNLVWVHSDIGFGGNRMPVTISHVYNANDRNHNNFGMGYGWRTNFNQLVYQWSVNSNYYIWEDCDGTKHYFKYVSSGTYEDEDGLELTLTTTGSGTTKYTIVDKNGNASYFDTIGRLTKQENNQQTKSNISITYTNSTENLISTIKDGAGRKYSFFYSNNLLSSISYTGSGSDELSFLAFGYTSSKLTTITNKDGKQCEYTYGSNNLLTAVEDIDGYRNSWTNIAEPPYHGDICELKDLAQKTLALIDTATDQMPAYRGWTEDYSKLIVFLDDLFQYDICNAREKFKYSGVYQIETRDACVDMACATIKRLLEGIEEAQKSLEKDLF